MNRQALKLVLFSVFFASLKVSADVICEGATTDEGYGYYHTQISFDDQGNSVSNLAAAVHFVNAEGSSDQLLDLQNHSTDKDDNYQPRKNEYAGMKRYVLARGWTNFFLVTPEGQTDENHFVAYLQQAGHDYGDTIKLICRKN